MILFLKEKLAPEHFYGTFNGECAVWPFDKKTNMKKYPLFFGALCLSFIGTVSAASFADVDVAHDNYQAIEFFRENGLIEGNLKDGKRFFRGFDKVTRAEALKVLMLAAQVPPTDTEGSRFPDVDATAWYAPYVNTAIERGIVEGFSDGKFYPEVEVRRAQLLKMATLAFGADDSIHFATDWDEEMTAYQINQIRNNLF